MRTNRVAAHMVLEGRLLRSILAQPSTRHPRSTSSRADDNRLRRPIFIVAAPRSGSTLLFETLAASPQICTLGGEAHWLIEGVPELRPGASGVESNRLLGEHYSDAIAERIVDEILSQLKDNEGRPAPAGPSLRLLEKTPKNALRVPFLDRLFPDAMFVFLWRDPRENLASIIEAWRSGNWRTYNGLEGFDGPWSLLLPPDWQRMRGKQLEEIAAFQWESANRILLDDLDSLPDARWTALSYSELTSDPAASIRKICNFLGLEVDSALATRVAGPLPLSRYTQTPPADGKWRRHEEAIQRVMPVVLGTWRRLKELR